MSRNQLILALVLLSLSLALLVLNLLLDSQDPRLIQALQISGSACVIAFISPLLASRKQRHGSSSHSSKGQSQQTERTERIRKALEAYYTAITREVKRVMRASDDYESELGAHKRNISKTKDMDNVQDIIKVVAEEIDLMRQTNKTLHSKLDEAQNTIEEQRQNIEQLSKEANYDELTGLLNRRQFDIRHKEIFRVFKSRGTPYGLLLADLDKFKSINDTHGHQAGDAALQLVSKTIPKNIRTGDIAARYGGEEFAVLLQDLNQQRLLDVAEKIRLAIANADLIFDDKSIPLTISIGAAYSEENRNEKDMINLADKALYKSKQRGRNRVSSEKDL